MKHGKNFLERGCGFESLKKGWINVAVLSENMVFCDILV